MKKFILLLVFACSYFSTFAQEIVASKPATLQVYFLSMDGVQAMMQSVEVSMLYDRLQMTGEVIISQLTTENLALQQLLDSAMHDRISFSGSFPEGKFMYHDMLNEKFEMEAELNFGDIQSRIMVYYEVSNRKTSLANTFDITGTGSISLKDDLGITRDTGFDDKVSFMFFQNVQTKTF